VGGGNGVGEDFQPHPELGAPAEEFGFEDGQNLGRNHHLQALREGQETTVAQNERPALLVVRACQVIAETKLPDQLFCPGLGGEPAFRAGFEDAAFHVDGPDRAAWGGIKDSGLNA